MFDVLDGAVRFVLGDQDFRMSPRERQTSTLGCRTGSAAPTAAPPSCSCCSAPRENGPT